MGTNVPNQNGLADRISFGRLFRNAVSWVAKGAPWNGKVSTERKMARFIDNIFDRTLNGLQRQLDLTWHRNQALTSNIANAETPQYRAVDVNFGNELARAFDRQASPMAKTNGQHLDLSAEQGSFTVADNSGLTKPDGNNVDIDLQMGRLASNSSAYGNAANLVKKKLGLIRNAIREAGR